MFKVSAPKGIFMDNKTIKKIGHLITQTRVMTIAVSMDNIPWSAPVYFVFQDNVFLFFSNKTSKHIEYADRQNIIAASLFNDADLMEDIYGLQMSGRIIKISDMAMHLKVIKKYVNKFDFLVQAFGSQIIDNPKFFLEKFKSNLYGFFPENIYLSDNSKQQDKRVLIDLDQVKIPL